MAKIEAGLAFCYPNLSVLKLFKYILNILVWSVLGLYLLVIITFHIPAVQTTIGEHAAAFIAQVLGTNVKIGRVVYNFPNHLTLYDVLVHDQQGKEMLKTRRLSARMDLLPLAEGKISIATAQLFGANAQLYQRDSLSQPNFQFVIDSLASKDTTSTSPLNLRINSLIVRYSNISYDRYDLAETPGVLNPNHLKVSDISAHIILKALTDDSVNVNVKRLSFKEKAGLQVDRLSMKYAGGKRHSTLQNFNLRMPGTDIKVGQTEAHYLIRNKELVLPSLRYSGHIEPSTITPSDFACFLPSLKSYDNTISLSSAIEGQDDNLTIPNLLIKSATSDIDVNIDGWVRNLREQEPSWQANINRLQLSGKTIEFISDNLKEKPTTLSAFVNNLGSINMKGIVKGEGMGTLDIQSHLNADAGDVVVSMHLDKQKAFQGDINTSGINLGRLLNDHTFGVLATNIHLEGRIPAYGDMVVNADGIINKLDYNGYTYNNISVNGSYSPQYVTGMLKIDDSNLRLNMEGNVEKGQHSNTINVTASVRDLSPHALRLSNKWDDARFGAELQANITGNGLHDAVGTVSLTGFNMESTQGNYHLDSLFLTSGYDKDSHIHHIELASDFADVSIRGDFEYKTLIQSFTNFIAAKLPTLPGLPKANPHSKNDFSINAKVYKSDWLQQLLGVPLELVKPVTLSGAISDSKRQVNIECDLPDFYYDGGRYDHAHVSIMSPLNTLLYNISANKRMDDGDFFELQMEGSAYNNLLTNTLTWNNHAVDHLSGKLTINTDFETTLDGRSLVNIKVTPSVLNVKDTEWEILPCHITYADNNLNISNFAIRHDEQHLVLNGIASKNVHDSLTVNLRGIEIGYILNLVNFHAVEFNGLASGQGNICGVFGNLQANANLQVEEFKFQQGRMGTLDAHVRWNTEAKQIDIHAIADDGPDAKTLIDGYVSPERNFIDLGIRAEGTHLDFARSFTESFISHVEGHGKGAVRLAGPLDAINLTGELVLNGKAHVKTLGCTYELRNDTLRMVPNEIVFAHCPIYDIQGNQGILSGGIHHEDLTNMTYDIAVDAQNLMAYDFPKFGDEMFYGTVFAQGTAVIHGRSNETLIEADVIPMRNSFFVYNAASPDVITNQEFIQWNVPSQQSGSQLPAMPANSEMRSDLTLRLKINMNPNATIRLLMDAATGDYITLHGNGELQATYFNKGGFNMFGNFEVNDGTYDITIQNIIKKNFTFKEGGTIVFAGDPYDAQLNLQAQHIVNGVSLSDLNVGQSFSNTVRVNCLMNITGQPRSPLVDFDLDILNVNADEKQMVRSLIDGQEEMRQQVIYLLAVGRFYPQGANNAEESENQRNSTSLAMQSLLSGTLSGQLNSMLSQIIKSNNWNFGANISTGDEGWNNAEYEGLISGRLLNNRLLINGQFGYRDNATTATPSFIGDFDIRYLLFPNGNLALKVYNQTNDRYFTRSSLNTQGIGIIMKKDFNGLHDLFRSQHKKKQKEEKKP